MGDKQGVQEIEPEHTQVWGNHSPVSTILLFTNNRENLKKNYSLEAIE